ncbi:hypothetical protein JCM30237_00960 [Halolamina litorea]|uniref:GNAT family N-acetyltransferase n=1 Tax=Halolamina litorea TaxID=1515593 RepID=A0ABD6BSU5_9EURY|nr:GNAT family N-acetyltransferase [Halolamina litorea]
MLPPSRVAAAEYAKRRVLADTTETRFGTFVQDPEHADRAAATQFLDARLPSASEPPTTPADDDAANDLLARVDALYERAGRSHRVVAGVDTETAARLAPVLRRRGYEREDYWALVPHLIDSPDPTTDLDFSTRSHGSDDARAVHESVGRDPEGVDYAADVAGVLDGREVVATLEGAPVGAAGWYVHRSGSGEAGPVARLTHVGIRPESQGRGVGAELIRVVVDRCPLPSERIVVCATADHVGFYESLGFVRNAALWRFASLP